MKLRVLIVFFILLSLGVMLWGMFTEKYMAAFLGFALTAVLANSRYMQKKFDEFKSNISQLNEERGRLELQKLQRLNRRDYTG